MTSDFSSLSSELSDTDVDSQNGVDLDETPNTVPEIVEDLTTEAEDLRSDASSPAAALFHDGTPVIKPRPYQLEMLEKSINRNAIVAMDTGSGKTQIAVLRIMYELEQMPTGQLVWFLAPTISLCAQQYEVLQSQITAVQIKFLSGNDGVDRWTDESQWSAVLRNVSIVVSTYQILLDALTHGFVRMKSLALIVFDEAHNCVSNHPGAKLMKNFYHADKIKGSKIPRILGLTASPIMRSDPASLDKIEEILDSRCTTPKKHRAELRLQVKLPSLCQICYQASPDTSFLTGYTRSIQSLGAVLRSLKLDEDPYVISLIQENSGRSQRKLEKVRLNHKTWCQDQIKTFYSTSLKICHELGSWAADYYISMVVSNANSLTDETTSASVLDVLEVSQLEKVYLAKALKRVEIREDRSRLPLETLLVSDKVTKLILALKEASSAEFSGIIFVQERATTEVLSRLLSLHPETRDIFKVGNMVGTSVHGARARNIAELVDLQSQKHVLGKFRSGAINLMVATSVLEEGIDIPACNVVICFQKPANLKSFVQRRGRARQRDSKLVLLLDSNDDKLGEYQKLEQRMKRMYEDEMRALAELLVVEDGEADGQRSFRVESTGAQIDLDNAVSHLYHFCATLPVQQHVDHRPEFICTDAGKPMIRAKVILPLSVHETVRTANSLASWQSERNAIKDAAFEAYVALYKAGLVNDNLLPLRKDNPDIEGFTSVIEQRVSIIQVNEKLNPWVLLAKAWENIGIQHTDGMLQQSTISLKELDLCIQVILPVDIPAVSSFKLYWDSAKTISVTLEMPPSAANKQAALSATQETLAMLQAAFGTRFEIQQKTPIMLFKPTDASILPKVMNAQTVTNKTGFSSDEWTGSLVRDILDPRVAYTFREWLPEKPPMGDVQSPYKDYDDVSQTSPHLSVQRIPRRKDFLHKVPPGNAEKSRKQYLAVIPESRCTVDEMPFRYVQFGLLMPSIIHRFGIYLLAQELSRTVLHKVDLTDINLVVTAISASSANEESNYQRIEFLGDSILKLCTSVQLMSHHPLWDEGLLSFEKDRYVSNARLSRAAIETGLDKFIVAKAFTGHKWRPTYVEDLVDPAEQPKRPMSTKVLADVVEALIGAAMLDGSYPKALSCLSIFLPELNWQPLEARRLLLYERTVDLELPSTLQPVETLIGYTFKKKAILYEAMTHASCNTGIGPLDRFEYLGDAILDHIIGTAMWPLNLSQMGMHLLRTATVNADFLAFICLEWSIDVQSVDLKVSNISHAEGQYSHTASTIKEVRTTTPWPLWRFMRHSSAPLARAQQATSKRHVELRGQIKHALENGADYPWALLARLQAPKYFSDIIESLICAVWIDSGSFETCTDMLERMGILRYFQRFVDDGVHVLHPKEELGMLAGNDRVKYTVANRGGGGGVESGSGSGSESGSESDNAAGNTGVEYLCKVSVGGREVVRVEGGVDRVEVRTKAAEAAVRILRMRKIQGEPLVREGTDEDMGGVM